MKGAKPAAPIARAKDPRVVEILRVTRELLATTKLHPGRELSETLFDSFGFEGWTPRAMVAVATAILEHCPERNLMLILKAARRWKLEEIEIAVEHLEIDEDPAEKLREAEITDVLAAFDSAVEHGDGGDAIVMIAKAVEQLETNDARIALASMLRHGDPTRRKLSASAKELAVVTAQKNGKHRGAA